MHHLSKNNLIQGAGTKQITKIGELTRWIAFGKKQDCKTERTNLSLSKNPSMLLALYNTRNMETFNNKAIHKKHNKNQSTLTVCIIK